MQASCRKTVETGRVEGEPNCVNVCKFFLDYPDTPACADLYAKAIAAHILGFVKRSIRAAYQLIP